MAKQALGKGLGALIRKSAATPAFDATLAPDDFKRVRDVALDMVVPSPLQPRTQFVESPLDDLVESIRQHGIIQPLIVRPVNGKLELIAGERRWRASAKLGLATVPVIEREASDRDVLEMALIENLQREDLNPMEEAAGYVRLAKEFSMKQDEIAGRVGKSRASVANAMRLLDLHGDVQMLVAQAASPSATPRRSSRSRTRTASCSPPTRSSAASSPCAPPKNSRRVSSAIRPTNPAIRRPASPARWRPDPRSRKNLATPPPARWTSTSAPSPTACASTSPPTSPSSTPASLWRKRAGHRNRILRRRRPPAHCSNSSSAVECFSPGGAAEGFGLP
jgi:ParB/RepB/Spo0J family partition protein